MRKWFETSLNWARTHPHSRTRIIGLLLPLIALCFTDWHPVGLVVQLIVGSLLFLKLSELLAETFFGPNRHKSSDLIFFTTCALVTGFYCFTANTSVAQNSAIEKTSLNYYSRLADGFLTGRLSLPDTPDPSILAVNDPYPPANRANARYYWDACLYKSKYYIYWGLTPLLTFVLPLKILMGAYPSDWFSCFWFAALAFLSTAFLVRMLLRDRLKIQLGPLGSFLLPLSVGLCSGYPMFLRRPAIYETAIFAGAAFLMLSLLLLQKASTRIGQEVDQKRRALLLFSGFAFALSVGARPTFALAAPVVGLLLLDWFNSAAPSANRKSDLMTFVLPVFFCALVIAAYNYLRFDSIFEFGLRYQLTKVDMRSLAPRFPDYWNAWRAYLFNPIQMLNHFPYLHAQLPTRESGWHWILTEPIVGLIYLMPQILFMFAVPFFKMKQVGSLSWRLWFLLLVLLAISMLSINCMVGISQRYAADFGMFLLIPPLLLYFSVQQWAGRHAVWLEALMSAVLVSGLWINATLSMSGIEDRFARHSPELYRIFERLLN